MCAASSKKLIERAAYHEAGHVVVAATKGIAIDRWGMCVDDREKGRSKMRLRRPEFQGVSLVSRKDSIIVLAAGFIAENRYDLEATERSASCDLEWIRKLEAEEPSIDSAELRRASVDMVTANWCVIEALASALLSQEFRVSPDREMRSWSDSNVAACLCGDQIASILAAFDIVVTLEGAGFAL